MMIKLDSAEIRRSGFETVISASQERLSNFGFLIGKV